MTGNGSKYRFSLVTVKEGIKAACLRTQAVGIKAPLQVSSEGHVIVKKSNNLISLRPIFLSPKNVRGVPRDLGPPPSRNMVKSIYYLQGDTQMLLDN